MTKKEYLDKLKIKFRHSSSLLTKADIDFFDKIEQEYNQKKSVWTKDDIDFIQKMKNLFYGINDSLLKSDNDFFEKMKRKYEKSSVYDAFLLLQLGTSVSYLFHDVAFLIEMDYLPTIYLYDDKKQYYVATYTYNSFEEMFDKYEIDGVKLEQIMIELTI